MKLKAILLTATLLLFNAHAYAGTDFTEEQIRNADIHAYDKNHYADATVTGKGGKYVWEWYEDRSIKSFTSPGYKLTYGKDGSLKSCKSDDTLIIFDGKGKYHLKHPESKTDISIKVDETVTPKTITYKGTYNGKIWDRTEPFYDSDGKPLVLDKDITKLLQDIFRRAIEAKDVGQQIIFEGTGISPEDQIE